MIRVKMHEDICNRLNTTYKAKNADYGDSFAKVRKEYPDAICIRLMDKLERLKTLIGGSEQQVTDESIDDTLLDLANYCIMELVERKVDEEEKVQSVVEELMVETLVADKLTYQPIFATPLEEKAMSIGEAISELARKDHAEHFWVNVENKGV